MNCDYIHLPWLLPLLLTPSSPLFPIPLSSHFHVFPMAYKIFNIIGLLQRRTQLEPLLYSDSPITNSALNNGKKSVPQHRLQKSSENASVILLRHYTLWGQDTKVTELALGIRSKCHSSKTWAQIWSLMAWRQQSFSEYVEREKEEARRDSLAFCLFI